VVCGIERVTLEQGVASLPVVHLDAGQQQKERGIVSDPPCLSAKYRSLQDFSKWAMLDLNQRPSPCELGSGFPSRFCSA
jgi:hypothetical protein